MQGKRFESQWDLVRAKRKWVCRTLKDLNKLKYKVCYLNFNLIFFRFIGWATRSKPLSNPTLIRVWYPHFNDRSRSEAKKVDHIPHFWGSWLGGSSRAPTHWSDLPTIRSFQRQLTYLNFSKQIKEIKNLHAWIRLII